jgi:hypothetical protein
MRAMSLLQMAGGVAVAGAVAAGTTAFTASGLTEAAGVSSGVKAGGATSITVNEFARVNTAVFTQSGTDPDQLTGVTLTLDNGTTSTALASGDVVKVKYTGTGTATAAWATCSTSNQLTYTCGVGGGSGYYTAITTLEVAVIPA